MTTGLLLGGCAVKTETSKDRATLYMNKKSDIELLEVLKPLDNFQQDSYNYAQVQSKLDSVAYKDVFEALKPYMNRWDFEACAENFPFQTGCISQRDADILGSNVVLMGNKGQRKGCLCPRNKSEMLTHKSHCQHGCLYCYWSNDYNSN
jgi:hypothetical protein